LKSRVDRFVSRFLGKKMGGALIFNPVNIQYLTGYKPFPGILLITKNDKILYSDTIYFNDILTNVKGFRIEAKNNNFSENLGSTLQKLSAGIIGFEENYVSVKCYNDLKKHNRTIKFLPLDGILDDLRAVKEPDEIEELKKAASIADSAFKHIVEYMKPGMKERHIAMELDYFMINKGADSVSFKTIVASGWRSALPHGEPTDKIIKEGELVILDFGAVVNGYHSDISRTIGIGNLKADLKKMYTVVRNVQEQVIKLVKPGMTGAAVDALARNLLESEGYGKFFIHSTGHGVGLDVHEEPRLSRTGDKVLQPHMVITIEPGIYIPEYGGARIEDMMLVEKSDTLLLTHSNKDLITI